MHHVYHRKLKGDTESIMKKERPSRMTKSKPEEKKKAKFVEMKKCDDKLDKEWIKPHTIALTSLAEWTEC